MIKKLDKLIIKTFIGPFIVTFFVTLFVLVMQFLWKYIDDLVGKGLDAFTVGKLLFYMSTTLVPMALPLAILLSSIMTFGNLGESFELVALKSSGISLVRFMRPLVIFSGFVCIGAFLFANYVIPVANLQASSLLYDIVTLKHGFNIKPGVFFEEIDNFAIKVAAKDVDGKTIHEVMIYDRRTPGSDKVILAESGHMEESANKKFVYMTLKNGWQYEERGNRASTDNEFIRTGFKEFREVIDLSSFMLSRTPIKLFQSSYQMLNVGQLNKAIDSIDRQMKYAERNMKADMTSRFAFARWPDSTTGWLQPESRQLKEAWLNSFAFYHWQDTGWLGSSVPTIRTYGFDSAGVAHWRSASRFLLLPASLRAISFESLIPKAHRRYVYDKVQMDLREIKNALEITTQSYTENVNSIVRHKVEWHRKFTLSFACMVLFLIGAPLGSIIRKGGLGTPLVFAVAFFVIFYIISTIGERLARNEVMQAVSGMWLSNVVLMPIAGFLIYKALNDSQLLNKEFYFRAFLRIRHFFHGFIHKRNNQEL